MITITPDAVQKVEQLLEREGKQGYSLRVFIAGGGCSGYQYGLMFDDQRQEDDEVVPAGKFDILIDGESAMLLYGAEIDYVDSLMGSGFTIRNPNAVASCACGQSFTVKQESGHAHAAAGGCGSGCGCGGH
ncbi:MAG: iron-sulfur cluster insertion protein ErpA [Chloroflexota bacterium]|nr:iron-sulfur cluster insertion protein ErpA [Dehalococcoidia bacterium]MDW8252724.1 iron-sulfur cluster insertion protein ErpA [Chloroflexota bacterium]